MGEIDIVPVTPDRWEDLAALFGDNGAYSNCWCTWWLLGGRGFDGASKVERRHLLHSEVEAGREPGLMAYVEGKPVGWCAVAPRHRYARLTSPRARVYRAIDDRETWVVTCFFVPRPYRGCGVATRLLEAAVEHASHRGATIVEGYPIDRATRASRAADLFVGTVTMFRDAGFDEAARVGDRPLMRRFIWMPAGQSDGTLPTSSPPLPNTSDRMDHQWQPHEGD